MDNTQKKMQDILMQQISGFHQYCLTNPIHLICVSQNLCEMTGMEERELLHEKTDCYRQLVHPADQEKYKAFLEDLKSREQTLTTEYRLIKKEGTIIWVRDYSTSRIENGIMISSSVLTDITDIKNENSALQFLNKTVPFGIIKYTCEKQPRVTQINQTMIDLLRIPKAKEGELDYLELYQSNIFLMIPMEERRRFSNYLDQVYRAEEPIAGELTLQRCDGTRAYVFGWVTKSIDEHGNAEFQSVCMDVTQRQQRRKEKETRQYLKALTDVYDKIFEFNLDANTAKCLYCEETSTFKALEGITVQIDDALEKWIIRAIEEEDRARVRTFFTDFCQKKRYDSGARPAQLSYWAKSSEGDRKHYTGMFIKVDEAISFYCCRLVQDQEHAEALKIENDQWKESVKAIVTRFSDGIAAFEISAAQEVRPLYASKNVCEFFGYTEEEWMPLTEKYTPMENFVAYSEAGYEEFEELLRNGETEFSYFDCQTAKERRIKAICSQKEPDSHASRYVMLYSVDDAEPLEPKAHLAEKRKVSIRTFGYFDVFIGDRPIAFRNKKAKELLALLVDRKGGYVTSEEAISFLWEDEPVNTVTLARYRKVALRLKNTLEEYGIADIMETTDGKRCIVREKVQCDLYDYLSGKEEYAQLFKGSYLTNYSWGETTLGELLNDY